jgi:hypothetical protein
MMGEHRVGQDALFYEFSLERHVPADHMLRSIDRFVDLSGVRAHLRPFWPGKAVWTAAENGGGYVTPGILATGERHCHRPFSTRKPRWLLCPHPDQVGLWHHEFVNAIVLAQSALDLGPGRHAFGVGGVHQQLRYLRQQVPNVLHRHR